MKAGAGMEKRGPHPKAVSESNTVPKGQKVDTA